MTDTDDDRLDFIEMFGPADRKAIIDELVYAYEQGKNNRELYRESLQNLKNKELEEDNRREKQHRAKLIVGGIVCEILEKSYGWDAYLYFYEGYDNELELGLEGGEREKRNEFIGLTDIVVGQKVTVDDVIELSFEITLENGLFRDVRNPLKITCQAEFYDAADGVPFDKIEFFTPYFTDEELDKIEQIKIEYDKVVVWCKTMSNWARDSEYFLETLRNWQFFKED